MTAATILRKVTAILDEDLNLSVSSNEPIQPGHKFFGDLGGDSLDAIEVIMAMEEEFGVETTEDETSALFHEDVTVGSIAEFINNKLAQQGGAHQ